ncbi:hypothetical protein [Acidiphilium acidophilum]|uniref:Mobilization protein n=1 Tax=Acidiphilium acidophilum TaxID=76588 RepID=A0AAW9DX30_ACIAO|nr:hypothetical protein [Acidiphilium acidophilum]MDX5933079.1 hypothetical protein [Acidiphilium acidophilum]GBR73959.1 hypothetical protein AA700_0199 [Acidiphilium acidophilum DSM 700]
MSEPEDRLYGLMEIAERQQAAVQAALDGLTAERAALERERQALAREVTALAQRTRQAVHSAVVESLAGAAGEGVAAVRVATQPLLGELAGVTTGAARAEAALRRVVQWASWRLLGWIMALIAALVLFGWLSSTALVWWDTGRISKLQDQIATLQANHRAWVKAGMLGALTICGPDRRPCVRVDKSAGAFGKHADYRVILGY